MLRNSLLDINTPFLYSIVILGACFHHPMSSLHEKVCWIHKYLLDSMNSVNKGQIQQRREDIERYAKRIDMDCLCYNQPAKQVVLALFV